LADDIVIDNRREDGCFPLHASCVANFAHPNSLYSSSEMGSSWNQKLEKKNSYTNELDVKKPLMVSISQRNKELRFYNGSLKLGNFKPWLKSSIFKCIAWLTASFFLSFQELSIGTNFDSEIAKKKIVFTPIVYDVV
jgi:hypothetical protein